MGKPLWALGQTSAPREAALRFAHVVAIHEFWLASIGLALPARIRTMSRRLRTRTAPDFSSYNSYWEVVLELLSHGAHWRGQIALLLRQAGCEPPKSTDFIPALRAANFKHRPQLRCIDLTPHGWVTDQDAQSVRSASGYV